MRQRLEAVTRVLAGRRRGAAAIEYALTLFLIAMAVAGVIAAVGGGVTDVLDTATNVIEDGGDGDDVAVTEPPPTTTPAGSFAYGWTVQSCGGGEPVAWQCIGIDRAAPSVLSNASEADCAGFVASSGDGLLLHNAGLFSNSQRSAYDEESCNLQPEPGLVAYGWGLDCSDPASALCLSVSMNNDGNPVPAPAPDASCMQDQTADALQLLSGSGTIPGAEGLQGSTLVAQCASAAYGWSYSCSGFTPHFSCQAAIAGLPGAIVLASSESCAGANDAGALAGTGLMTDAERQAATPADLCGEAPALTVAPEMLTLDGPGICTAIEVTNNDAANSRAISVDSGSLAADGFALCGPSCPETLGPGASCSIGVMAQNGLADGTYFSGLEIATDGLYFPVTLTAEIGEPQSYAWQVLWDYQGCSGTNETAYRHVACVNTADEFPVADESLCAGPPPESEGLQTVGSCSIHYDVNPNGGYWFCDGTPQFGSTDDAAADGLISELKSGHGATAAAVTPTRAEIDAFCRAENATCCSFYRSYLSGAEPPGWYSVITADHRADATGVSGGSLSGGAGGGWSPPEMSPDDPTNAQVYDTWNNGLGNGGGEVVGPQ